jgi:hypothetical protein
MYARGMSTREITGHLHELYGVNVSPDPAFAGAGPDQHVDTDQSVFLLLRQLEAGNGGSDKDSSHRVACPYKPVPMVVGHPNRSPDRRSFTAAAESERAGSEGKLGKHPRFPHSRVLQKTINFLITRFSISLIPLKNYGKLDHVRLRAALTYVAILESYSIVPPL